MVNGKKQRRLPYYKRVAGTPFVVDAFSYGDIPDCEGYFLSHFHSDHYMGLNSHWIHGTIYCSEITARLVRSQLGVHPDFIQPIPLHIPTVITTHPLIKVTLIEANHCPGSVVFLFEMPEMGVRYLHTGDFRASPDLSEHPLIRQPDNPPIDILYLDTTYLDPKYSFPSQESCINAACEIALHHAELYNRVTSDKKLDGWLIKDTKEEVSTKTLFIVGVYTLGKEAVFINMAKSLNTKVFVTDEKRSILDCFKDKNLDDLFTDEPREAQVHAIPLNHLQPRNLEAYLSSLQPFFTEIIAIKPTGWTYRDSSDPYHPPPRSLESIQNEHKTSDDLIEVIMRKPIYDSIKIKIYGVPYSEHSSFRELALFISSLHIRRIVPTVHTSSKTSRINMSVFFDRWEQEKRERCQ
ncbi:DNA repair metallo-beta-lactamase-domain-containing protein [Pilobolus umbonatus]|nr:DNA repair metallo-beta-lactamase-domain-containing protein [Pilobolus umbonatus]